MVTEFKELSNWEKDLNICIRCGYCYENCHMFRLSDWEADTPRGKLLLIYGLLGGQIEPSDEIAEKIFECLYCRNCETSCSAKVPVTEIFKDAKLELVKAGFEAEGSTSEINQDMCGRCGICISVCKVEAVTKKEDGTVEVDRTKCEGCGVCAASCPSEAISLKSGYGVTHGELFERVVSVLS